MALRIAAAWVFTPGRHACPGWEWVPFIAIAWGHMLAGYFLHVLDKCNGGIFHLQREGRTTKKKCNKKASVHMHISVREYIC